MSVSIRIRPKPQEPSSSRVRKYKSALSKCDCKLPWVRVHTVEFPHPLFPRRARHLNRELQAATRDSALIPQLSRFPTLIVCRPHYCKSRRRHQAQTTFLIEYHRLTICTSFIFSSRRDILPDHNPGHAWVPEPKRDLSLHHGIPRCRCRCRIDSREINQDGIRIFERQGERKGSAMANDSRSQKALGAPRPPSRHPPADREGGMCYWPINPPWMEPLR